MHSELNKYWQGLLVFTFANASIKNKYPMITVIWTRWCFQGADSEQYIGIVANDANKSNQTEFDKEAWIKFIEKYGIESWTNVCDIQTDPEGNPAASSNWRDEYDIYSTPVIYLLDKDKKILAKRISYSQISKVIKRLEEIDN